MIQHLAVSGLVLSVLAACGDSTVPVDDPANNPSANSSKDGESCTYKGKVYKDQQEWKDACNSCKCNAEGTIGASCTQMACPPEDLPPEGTCTFEGKVYKDQEEWRHDCNSCRCDAGGAMCTTQDCDDDLPCGNVLCGQEQICVYPCCGGVGPMCEPKNDDGTCPPGFHEGCSNGMDGCEPLPCTPPPPYCADEAPAGCGVSDRTARCLCA